MHNTVYRLLIEGASGTKPQVTFPMLRQPGLKYLTTIIAYSSYSFFFLFAFFFFFLFFSKILAFKLHLNSRLNKVMLCYVTYKHLLQCTLVFIIVRKELVITTSSFETITKTTINCENCWWVLQSYLHKNFPKVT